MMSSGKQTKAGAAAAKRPLFSRRQRLGVLAVVVLAGWLLVLSANRWHLTPGTVFMCIAWLAVVMTAKFLWQAGMTAASEGDADDGDYWRPIGRRHELEVEKRTLIKAIKEIEFDHNLGKMSAIDAKSLTAVYRRRAIDVIKAIDALEDDESELATVRDKIERDVKARLEVDKATSRAKKKKKKKKKDKQSAGKPESVAESESSS